MIETERAIQLSNYCSLMLPPHQEWCLKELMVWTWATEPSFHWYLAAFVAIAPIVFVWLMAYAIVVLVRWVSRGFKPTASP
jgi:hypothetical protein